MSESGMKLIFWVLLTSLLGAMIAAPQAVAAWEMPSLVLKRSSAAEAVHRDETLASTLDQESPEVAALQRLFLEHGRREAEASDTRKEHDRRQVMISHGIERLQSSAGPEAVAALRADALERFMQSFSEPSTGAKASEDLGLLGAFPEMLGKYGLVRDGVLVAPELTLRSVYKARWNAIHRRPLVDDFSPIELQAYWGWVALHAPIFPTERRLEALSVFAEAGGRGATEARAMFALIAQQPEAAIEPLQQLYRDTGRIRLRNLALGAGAAALQR